MNYLSLFLNVVLLTRITHKGLLINVSLKDLNHGHKILVCAEEPVVFLNDYFY